MPLGELALERSAASVLSRSAELSGNITSAALRGSRRHVAGKNLSRIIEEDPANGNCKAGATIGSSDHVARHPKGTLYPFETEQDRDAAAERQGNIV